MQATALNIFKSEQLLGSSISEEVSLVPFLNYLQQRTRVPDPSKRLIPAFVLDKLTELQQKYGSMSASNHELFAEGLYLIFNLTTSMTGDDEQALWGIASPISQTVFYGTDAFYTLLTQPIFTEDQFNNPPITGSIAPHVRQMYSLVLQRFYGFPLTDTHKLSYTLKDDHGNPQAYYELHIDYSFVDITYRGILPTIDYSQFRNRNKNAEVDWSQLIDALDLSQFEFSGFSILSLKDITEEHVTSRIKSMMSNLSIYEPKTYFSELEQHIKTFFGSQDINFSLFPLFYLNGGAILDSDFAQKSILFGPFQKYIKQYDSNFLSQYLQIPYSIVYNLVDGMDNSDTPLLHTLQEQGIMTYLALPLYYNHSLSGVLEIYSSKEATLDNTILSKLRQLITLLSQLAFDLSLEFKNRLDSVIIEHFTALQPAVQWKFNEVAAEYLGKLFYHKENSRIQTVHFPNVYPLYGAIDVRDSSVLRNIAIKKDFQQQHFALEKLISDIRKIYDPKSTREFHLRIQQSQHLLEISSFDEAVINATDFLQNETPSFFAALAGQNPVVDGLIAAYHCNSEQHPDNTNRFQREFETSIQQLNAIINAELDTLNAFIQGNYPSYFERFRTDGVEYDIYVGSSITPQQVFDNNIIRIFRLQQLITMARIGIKLQHIKSHLPLALETTQLIFVSTNNIDISFRSDERRFDVEGSYNIRHQIIKKRLDKIRVKDTLERLTQPQKISLVYFSDHVVSELKESIRNLQTESLLAPGIEDLELEKVPGVDGLRALRVTINLDYSL